MTAAKRIDLVRLIDTIGRKLQDEMTFDGIRQYLPGFGVDIDRPTSGYNSKWRFVKDLLGPEPVDRVLDIADDLDIAHGLRRGPGRSLIETKFWLPGYFKLFLSHVSAFKVQTSKLQTALKRFGVSAFVAHEDIEPTLEWQTEIEKALFSMDALAAVLSPGFHESKWTDQEVGVAIGRDVLVIALRVGVDPYGFIGKHQGVPAKGKRPGEVAELIFEILATNPTTTGPMAIAIVTLILHSQTEEQADQWLQLLRRFRAVPLPALHKLSEGAMQSEALATSEKMVRVVNDILERHKMPPVVVPQKTEGLPEDDIPF